MEGNKCRYYLPCYGKYDATVQKAAKALGCTVVTYSKNPIIANEQTMDEIMMCFSEGIKNGDIIYFDLNYHDKVTQVIEEVLTLSEKSTLKVETANKLMEYYVPNKHYSYTNVNKSNNRVKSSTTLVRLDKVEESAEEKEKETELMMLQEEIKLLVEKNNGKLATEQKSLKLVEDAIAFEFYGISNIATVNLVIETLEEMNARGTFFVSLEDTEACGKQIEMIKNAGHEIGIAYCPRRDATVNDMALMIYQTKQALFEKYNVEASLVFQPWSKISDELKEATSAMNLTLVSYDTGIVRTEQKEVTDAQSVMDVLFTPYNYCAVQGQIFYFRMDYYTDENVLVDVMKLLKEQKVDNIKYRPENKELVVDLGKYDGYEIVSVSELLQSDMVYIYPLTDDKMAEAVADGVYEKKVSLIDVMEAAVKGYIGTPSIYQEDKLPGFTEEEIKQLDYSGLIHTDKNEIFLSFDDWGSDVAINQLLYVLEKHQVKATFFVSTKNVKDNPNLLRKIALAGHQLASHTDQHITLSNRDENTEVYYELSEEELEIFEKDIVTSYETLKSIAGDVVIDDVPAVTTWFRPPTLAVGRDAMEVVFESGYSHILSGNISTHDYEAQCVDEVYNVITDNLYHEDGSLIKGSLIVMHMSDEAKYTAEAIDVLLTENEKKSEGDTSKFTIGNLPMYLGDN